MQPFVLDVSSDPSAPSITVPGIPRELKVVSCGGPAAREGWGGCPLQRDFKCWRLEDAAFVVFRLDLDLAANRALLARYARKGVPLRVVTTRAKEARWASQLRDLEVVAL